MGISSGQHVALTKEQFSIWESPLLQTIVQSWQKNKKQTGENGISFVLRKTCQMKFCDLEIREWQYFNQTCSFLRGMILVKVWTGLSWWSSSILGPG